MWLINIFLLLLVLSGYLYCLKMPKEWIHQADKQEHKLYFLYPLSAWILTKSGIEKVLDRRDDISDTIRALYLTNRPEQPKKLFRCKQLSLILMVLFLFNLLSLLGYCLDLSNPTIINHNYIIRPGYGEGKTKADLNLTIDATDSEGDNGLPKSQEVTINVNERLYAEEKVEELFDKAKNYLTQEVLGGNQSPKEILSDLNFVRDVPGTSVTVRWFPQDYSLIRSDGTVCNDEINGTGKETTVKAVLKYYEYSSELMLTFHLLPKKYSKEEQFKRNLTETMREYADNTTTEQMLELPSSVDGIKLFWEDKRRQSGLKLFVFGLVLAVILWIYGEKGLELRMKKRKQQLLMDYPEIVNKFTLLINAGMTIRQAWYKITDDYSGKTNERHLSRRYAYEEMITTVRELKLGVPEKTAYEQFGRRCGLIPYIKFSSLISQNLKKGTKGFVELLMKEAVEAFEERKEAAKRMGEEAGTKLLFPMMVMLIIVFLIIMIPAFSAFSI